MGTLFFNYAYRWVQGCKELNKLEYSFYLYDDDYLRRFTEKHYPSYFQLFKVLSGVCKCNTFILPILNLIVST